MHPIIAELLVTAHQQDIARSVRSARQERMGRRLGPARRHHGLAPLARRSHEL